MFQRSLNEIEKHFKIKLIWMPGHQDIEGNYIARELARVKSMSHFLIVVPKEPRFLALWAFSPEIVKFDQHFYAGILVYLP